MNRFVSFLWVAVLVGGVPLANATAGLVADDFNTAHNYAGGNVAGTIWSGVLNAGNADVLNTSSGGLLFDVANGVGYDGGGKADAPFLYVNTPAGDFDARVQVPDFPWPDFYDPPSTTSWATVGLMAYSDSNNFVVNQLDAWLYASNRLRTVAGGVVNSYPEDAAEFTYISGPNPSQLRLTRVGNVFHVYGRNSADSVDTNTGWVEVSTGVTRADLAGALKVGLTYGTFSSFDGTTTFENFQLTSAPEPSSIVLLSVSAFGLLAYAWRKRK